MGLGDLIPRHIQIFSNNQFFRGLQIPEPSKRVSHLLLVLKCIVELVYPMFILPYLYFLTGNFRREISIYSTGSNEFFKGAVIFFPAFSFKRAHTASVITEKPSPAA